MRLLLDTHVWLWVTTNDARLSQSAREAIEDRKNEVYVSAATAWEVAIKYRLGKLALPLPPHEYVSTMMAREGFLPLAITIPHAAAVASLPDHHRDPFDRLLIAQALHENLVLVTVDPIVRSYAVARLDA